LRDEEALHIKLLSRIHAAYQRLTVRRSPVWRQAEQCSHIGLDGLCELIDTSCYSP
jgi:hypothetical protein